MRKNPNHRWTGPKLVGRIASVPADKRFVLIQSYGPWEIETGRILTTRGPDERTANLRTTGEKLGEFAAADLQSGTVEVGDAVYSQHVPKPVASRRKPGTPHPHQQNRLLKMFKKIINFPGILCFQNLSCLCIFKKSRLRNRAQS